MPALVKHPAATAETPAYQEDELLDAFGLDAGLPEALLQDAADRVFEPFQLSTDHDLAEQLALLLRSEPLGGAEMLVAENAQRADAQADQQLRQVLTTMRDVPRSFFQGLIDLARNRREPLAAQLAQQSEQLQRVQERLHAWQSRQSEPEQGFGGALLRWIIGGEDRLSLPDAIALWNQREHLAARRVALHAATQRFARLIETLSLLLAQMDTRLGEARDARAAALRAAEQARQPATTYSPWTLHLAPAMIADALIAQADPALLVADLLARLTAEEGASLSEQVQALAAEAADAALARLTIADLAALEAGAYAAGAADPLLPIGQALLDLAQQPSWQLARNARPRSETLQITPDGRPIYQLEGLGSAAYGGNTLCLGFVQVQLGVAKADLAALRDDDDGFRATLRQRNLFVLEELALAWAPAAGDMTGNGHAPLAEHDALEALS